MPDYRCLCGAASITLRRKLHKLAVEPRPCACSKKKKGQLSWQRCTGSNCLTLLVADSAAEACPAQSCAAQLREMRELYDYHCEFISWATMAADNVARTSFAHTTELAHEWSATRGDGVVWRAYRCAQCKFVTHAVSSNGQLQVVINLKGKAILM